MEKTELKSNIEKLLEQLEQEESNVLNHFLEKFNAHSDDWTDAQNDEYEKTMKHMWDAGDSLASVIHSLE